MIKTSSRWTLIEGFNTWGEGFCSEAEAGRPSRDSSTPLSRNPVLFSSVLGTTIHCVPFLAPPPTLPVQIEHEVTDWRFIWPWKDFSRPSFLFSKSRTRRILIRALNSNILFCARMQSTMESMTEALFTVQSGSGQVFFAHMWHTGFFIRPFPSNQKQATFACHHIKKFWKRVWVCVASSNTVCCVWRHIIFCIFSAGHWTQRSLCY